MFVVGASMMLGVSKERGLGLLYGGRVLAGLGESTLLNTKHSSAMKTSYLDGYVHVHNHSMSVQCLTYLPRCRRRL